MFKVDARIFYQFISLLNAVTGSDSPTLEFGADSLQHDGIECTG